MINKPSDKPIKLPTADKEIELPSKDAVRRAREMTRGISVLLRQLFDAGETDGKTANRDTRKKN